MPAPSRSTVATLRPAAALPGSVFGMRIAGLVLALCAMLVPVLIIGRGTMSSILDPWTLAGVSLGTFGTLIAGFGADRTRAAMRALAQPVARRRTAVEAAQLFRAGALLSVLYGTLLTIVGMARVLANLNDPASVGAALGTTILAQFHGLALALLLFVAGIWAGQSYRPSVPVATRGLMTIAGLSSLLAAVTALLVHNVITKLA